MIVKELLSKNVVIMAIMLLVVVIASIKSMTLQSDVEASLESYQSYQQGAKDMIAINQNKQTIDAILNHSILRKANIKRVAHDNATVVTLDKKSSSPIAPNIFIDHFLNSSLNVTHLSVDETKIEIVVKK
jgi:hypothetical protein